MVEPETYGLLTVIGPTTQRNSQRERLYRCRCACGNLTNATRRALRRGEKKSCGCLRSLKVVHSMAPPPRVPDDQPHYTVRGQDVPLPVLAAVLGREPEPLHEYIDLTLARGQTVEAAVMTMLR
jgi:hypothetical protein